METKENIVETNEQQAQIVVPNKNRQRIDKLMGLPDLKYRGIFSGRTMKILGFVLMFFAQVCVCLNLVYKMVEVPAGVKDVADVLEVLSIFALPMFLAANFCIIMTSREKIKKMLIIYSAIAILIYLLVILVFYRYLMGIGKVVSESTADAYDFADMVAKKVFGKVINYNVFVDLSLFSLFYFFLFYTPKKIKKDGAILVFRFMCIIPILFAVGSTVLYGLNNTGIVELPVAALAIMPCRSITIYAIFFGVALIIKLRQYLFAKWGGTPEEYDTYAKSNRSSLEISVISAVIMIVVCAIDFGLIYVSPWFLFYGIGFNFYLAFAAPLILLLSYTRKTKASLWDIIMVVLFVFAVIILYLETGLYIITH